MEELDDGLFNHLLGYLGAEDAACLGSVSTLFKGWVGRSDWWKVWCKEEIPAFKTPASCSFLEEIFATGCNASGYKDVYAGFRNRVLVSVRGLMTFGEQGYGALLLDLTVDGVCLLSCTEANVEVNLNGKRRHDWDPYDLSVTRACGLIHLDGFRQLVLEYLEHQGGLPDSKVMRNLPRTGIAKSSLILFGTRDGKPRTVVMTSRKSKFRCSCQIASEALLNTDFMLGDQGLRMRISIRLRDLSTAVDLCKCLSELDTGDVYAQARAHQELRAFFKEGVQSHSSGKSFPVDLSVSLTFWRID